LKKENFFPLQVLLINLPNRRLQSEINKRRENCQEDLQFQKIVGFPINLCWLGRQHKTLIGKPYTLSLFRNIDKCKIEENGFRWRKFVN
jgi:hypothetical protein